MMGEESTLPNHKLVTNTKDGIRTKTHPTEDGSPDVISYFRHQNNILE